MQRLIKNINSSLKVDNTSTSLFLLSIYNQPIKQIGQKKSMKS